MTEWWTYRPRDFVLFSEPVYWRLFELANAALWPLLYLPSAVGLALAGALLWLAARPALVYRVRAALSRSRAGAGA